MPNAVQLPYYAREPGTAGPTPRGVHHDPATSFRMAKTLLKAARPHMKGKSKGRGKAKPARTAKPTHVSKK